MADQFGSLAPDETAPDVGAGWLDKLAQTWPAKLAQTAFGALALPGDVYAGRAVLPSVGGIPGSVPAGDPAGEQSLERAADLAGTVMGGSYAAPAMKDASGMGIRAYHGSPHDFDRFDLSKIGTGEGAQAYGHGLYFAEKEGVAKAYRDALSNSDLMVAGNPYNAKDPAHFAAATLAEYKSPDEAIRNLKAQIAEASQVNADWAKQSIAQKQDVIARIMRGGLPETKEIPHGKMYEVDIKAHPDQFLDWDKTIYQQSQHVQDSLAQARGKPVSAFGHEVPSKDYALHSPQQTKEFAEAGIPGIKYLDQGSRGAGEGSRNYVVFDDNLVDILKKYGIAGLPAGGAAFGALAPDDKGM